MRAVGVIRSWVKVERLEDHVDSVPLDDVLSGELAFLLSLLVLKQSLESGDSQPELVDGLEAVDDHQHEVDDVYNGWSGDRLLKTPFPTLLRGPDKWCSNLLMNLSR